MAGSFVKKRKITIEPQTYTYSVIEKSEYIGLSVYNKKQLFLCLRINWIESWGINLFFPKTVAFIIRYYQNVGFPYAIRYLQEDQSLFLELADFLFDISEQYEKTEFIKRCQQQNSPKEL